MQELPDGTHLPPTIKRWPDPVKGPWFLRLHWQLIAGRAECVGLTIRSSAPSDERESRSLPKIGIPVTSDVLRGLTMRVIEEDRRDMGHVTGSPAYKARRTPPGTSERLVEAANVYKRAWLAGDHPTKAVAEHFVISASAAAKVVARAREADLLPATSRGRALGQKRRQRRGRNSQ